MAEPNISINLSVKDNATKAVQTMAGAFGASTKAVKSLGAKGVNAMKAIGASIVVVNQALELGKKAFGAVNSVLSGTVQAMKDLRGRTNPIVDAWDRLSTQGKAVQASFGAALMSALAGVGQAFSPLIKSMVKYVDANRDLIATNIVALLFKIAQVLISGVAKGAQIANTAWSKLRQGINAVRITMAEAVIGFTKMQRAISPSKEEWGRLTARILKYREIIYEASDANVELVKTEIENREAIEKVQAALARMVAEGYGPAIAASKLLARQGGATTFETQAQAMDRLRDEASRLIAPLDEASQKIGLGLDRKTGMRNFEEYERKIDRMNRMLGVASKGNIREIRDGLEAIYTEMGVPFDMNIDMTDVDRATEGLRIFADTAEVSLLDAKEKFNLFHDALEDGPNLVRSLKESFAGLAGVMSTWGDQAVGIMDMVNEGALTAAQGVAVMAKKMLASIIGMVRGAIIAYAAQAAAVNLASAFPLILGVGLAAAAMSAVMALLNKVPSASAPVEAAEGGLITGGTPGRDSVPALLTPGEMVLSVDDVNRIRKGGGLGQQAVINVELNSRMPQSREEIKRYVRDAVVPALRSLRSQGMF